MDARTAVQRVEEIRRNRASRPRQVQGAFQLTSGCYPGNPPLATQFVEVQQNGTLDFDLAQPADASAVGLLISAGGDVSSIPVGTSSFTVTVDDWVYISVDAGADIDLGFQFSPGDGRR